MTANLGGSLYADFLDRTLPLMLEDASINVHEGMWF
jgi:hypothetical protein